MARVLFVTSRLPFPPREGHQLRSWHVLKALATQHEVTLLSFARADDELDAAGEMRSHLADVETFPIASERSKLALAWALLRSTFSREPFVSAKYASRAMRARIAELSRDADVVHFDMLPLMRYADAVPASVPIVYNAHNVEHVLLSTRARMHDNWLARLFLRRQLSRLLGFERHACRRAKLVLACSGTDAQLLRMLAPETRVTIVPNGVDLENNRPAHDSGNGRARLVFVGQMGWFPNRDGVEWFLHDVFPRIVLERPDAEFVLVGKTDGLEVPADIASHVKLAGFVPDLRPLVHAAAVYVVPLRAGSGTRLKVLEAMALGKAIVTTAIGSEGIVLRHGRSALYADDATTFAKAVVSLLGSPALRSELGTAARACAENHYGWDAIGLDLLAFYEPLLPDTWAPSQAEPVAGLAVAATHELPPVPQSVAEPVADPVPEARHATPETVSIAGPELALGTASITTPAPAFELESMPVPEPELETVSLHPPETVLEAAPDLFSAAVPEIPTETAPEPVLEATAGPVSESKPEVELEVETLPGSPPEPVLESMLEHTSDSILEPTAALESALIPESLPASIPKPLSTRKPRKKAASPRTQGVVEPIVEVAAIPPVEQAPKPERRRKPRKDSTAHQMQDVAEPTVEVTATPPADVAPKPERRRKPRKTGAANPVQDVAKPVGGASTDVSSDQTPKPERRRKPRKEIVARQGQVIARSGREVVPEPAPLPATTLARSQKPAAESITLRMERVIDPEL